MLETKEQTITYFLTALEMRHAILNYIKDRARIDNAKDAMIHVEGEPLFAKSDNEEYCRVVIVNPERSYP